MSILYTHTQKKKKKKNLRRPCVQLRVLSIASLTEQLSRHLSIPVDYSSKQDKKEYLIVKNAINKKFYVVGGVVLLDL